MRTEFLALRTVPSYRRALALAIAFSAFLAISFLGLKDLASTAPVDARSALSSGAVTGFVAIVFAAAGAGGEVARGGLALALLGGLHRGRAVLDRFAAYGAAGAVFGLAGALAAAILTYALLGIAGGPVPGVVDFLGRAVGTILHGALMAVLGAALGLALRSSAAAIVTALVVLLALDPLFAGLSDPVAHWGIGGASAAVTGAGAGDLPPPWAGGLVLAAYAAALAALAATLTARRDVP